MGDEELRAIGVGTSVSHREDAGFAVFQTGAEFVSEGIARSSATGAGRVASLSHEIFDNTVENGVVIVAFTRQEDKIVDGIWSFISEEGDFDIAKVGLEDGGVLFVQIELKFRGFCPLFLCHFYSPWADFIRGAG